MNTNGLRIKANRLITLNIALLLYLATAQTDHINFILPLYYFSGYITGTMFQEVTKGLKQHRGRTSDKNRDRDRHA